MTITMSDACTINVVWDIIDDSMIINNPSSHQDNATTWSITYDCHSDDSRGVIYAPRVIN